MADLIYNIKRFNGNDYSFLLNDMTPRYYLPVLSDPSMKDSDGDDIVDRFDDYPLWVDPDLFAPSNISSIKCIY